MDNPQPHNPFDGQPRQVQLAAIAFAMIGAIACMIVCGAVIWIAWQIGTAPQ